ncbi:hypothetical protein LINPERPRIM_LOCUS26341 [Linum perenne]
MTTERLIALSISLLIEVISLCLALILFLFRMLLLGICCFSIL